MDKAVEVIKAAMEKEKVMKENTNKSMDQGIDEETLQDTINHEAYTEASKEEFISDSDEVEKMDEVETLDEAETAENEEISEDADDMGNVQNNAGKSEKSVKSFFKNNKSKELAAKDQKIDELTDRLMRTMAEFDNFRKRTEKEKSMMYDMGVRSMIEKILPIVDNFERGFGTITDKDKESAFAQGIELIYKQLLNALDEIGLKPIDAVGKEFDPNLHNAVMHGEDDSLGENIVSDEFQKGYLYRDMVVRHSMVKVVN